MSHSNRGLFCDRFAVVAADFSDLPHDRGLGGFRSVSYALLSANSGLSRQQLVAQLAAYASRLPLYPTDPISRRLSVAQQNNMLLPVALAGNNIGNIWWPRRLTGHCSKWSLLAEGNRWRY
ncbi:hypothetical protein AVEN_40004-1 [Araneus ventricosus]|uniref:Uncharacterized protein n=1 Tax=Araneus ventricosus TaxID=182803 RepID=A0A4Y2TFU9_ARAVE|nr:hypothetical protein AVEN_40004-1 [Araneus ventricosus]